ncbi:MAG: hypothetical protein ABI697_13305 [Devosia sp.]
MGAKASRAGGFYRDDAARLVSEAARALQPEPVPQAPGHGTPVIHVAEPNRPPLSPRPALNQNGPELVLSMRRPLRWFVAWLLLTPLYLAVAAVSLVVIVAIFHNLLHL